MKDLSKRAREIIEKIHYITIASVTPDGKPWNSPVFSAYDEAYNFYWGTHVDSQKAKNIRANNNVFLTIYDSTVPPGAGLRGGIYIQAVAEELTDIEQIKQAFNLLKDRHRNPFWEFAVTESGPIRLYRAIPEKVWINDAGEKDGYFIDIRTEVSL